MPVIAATTSHSTSAALGGQLPSNSAQVIDGPGYWDMETSNAHAKPADWSATSRSSLSAGLSLYARIGAMTISRTDLLAVR